MNKLVSIITPCYNGEKYLPAFLDSVLTQTYKPLELIFINDGSTDSTENILHEYAKRFEDNDINLTYIFQQNAGQAAAINKGLKVFLGEYIMWVDSDDILMPNNVEVKIQYLEEHPDLGFVLSEGVCVHENDPDYVIGRIGRYEKAPHKRFDLFNDLIMEQNVVYGPGTVMVRRDNLLQAIPTKNIYESRQGQNWQLMLPLAYINDYGLIYEPLFKYVIHNDSHSHSRKKYYEEIERMNEFEKIVLKTIQTIPNINNRELAKWSQQTCLHFVLKRFETACNHFHLRDAYKERQTIKKLQPSESNISIINFEWCRIMRIINKRRKKK